VVIVSPAATLRVRDCVAVWGVGDVLSVALTVNVNVPFVVGVPERPPPGVRERLGGKLPVERDHVYGAVPPEAERSWA
jgi:hypothetical protein